VIETSSFSYDLADRLGNSFSVTVHVSDNEVVGLGYPATAAPSCCSGDLAMALSRLSILTRVMQTLADGLADTLRSGCCEIAVGRACASAAYIEVR